MNLLDQFRLRPTIAGFGGNTIPIGQRTTGPFIPNQGVGAIRPTESPLNPPALGPTQIQKTNTPEPIGLNEFRQYLQNQPERRDYQLGKLGKALSMVAGAAEGYNRGVTPGINVGMSLLNRPYEEAREDWQTRGGRLKELYELGRTERGEEREDIATKLSQNQDTRAQLALMQQLAKGEIDIQAAMQDVAAGKKSYMTAPDGNIYEIDHITNTVTPKKKVGESQAETRAGELAADLNKMQYQQFNALELRAFDAAHDKVMAGVNHGYATQLRELDSRLDKELATHQIQIDPAKRIQARNGAIDEILTQYPGLKAALFDVTTDADGNVTGVTPKIDPKTGNPVDVRSWEAFSTAVQERTKEYLGVSTPGGTVAPWTAAPLEDVEYRIEAIKQIREEGIVPTEANIKKATADLKARTLAGSSTQVPSVTTPSKPELAPNRFQAGDPGTWGQGVSDVFRNIGRRLATPTMGATTGPSEIPIQVPAPQIATPAPTPIIPLRPQGMIPSQPPITNPPLINRGPMIPSATPTLPPQILPPMIPTGSTINPNITARAPGDTKADAETEAEVDQAIANLQRIKAPVNSDTVAAELRHIWEQKQKKGIPNIRTVR